MFNYIKTSILTNQVVSDKNSQQNLLASSKSYLQKIVLTLPLNKIESNTHKFLNNFDYNAQVKGLIFFYLFVKMPSYISYRRSTKESGYSFSFKICLKKAITRLEFLNLVFFENQFKYSSPASSDSIRPASKLAINFKIQGALLASVAHIFKSVYADFSLKNFYFNASFIHSGFGREPLLIKS